MFLADPMSISNQSDSILMLNLERPMPNGIGPALKPQTSLEQLLGARLLSFPVAATCKSFLGGQRQSLGIYENYIFNNHPSPPLLIVEYVRSSEFRNLSGRQPYRPKYQCDPKIRFFVRCISLPLSGTASPA